MKLKYIAAFILSAFAAGNTFAGNPDRLGQAGATELLINSWARSSGWGGVNTAGVQGIESHNINSAGLSKTKTTEIALARTNWLLPSGITITNFGFAQRIGDDDVIGIGLVSFNLGDIMTTTTDHPEGGLGTYKPQFINLGLSYAHSFSERISTGIVARAISEEVVNVKAQGFALDFGIQYITSTKKKGESAKQNDLKFGITLKNVGPDMSYSGDGLSIKGSIADGYQSTVNTRAANFNLPTTLVIGASYDLNLDNDSMTYNNRLTLASTFFSNTFQKNQLGLGLEYAFKEQFFVRTAYVYESQLTDKENRTNALTGFSVGAGVDIAFDKAKKTVLGLDYSYRTTNPFLGVHSIGLRLSL